MQFFAILIGMS